MIICWEWINSLTSLEKGKFIKNIKHTFVFSNFRMLNYSTRVSLEVIFLLTVSEYCWFTLKINFLNIQDLINQTHPSNKPSLAIMLVNDNILDALRYNYHPEHLCQNYFSVSSWTQLAMWQFGLYSTLSILLLRIWLMVGQRLPFLWNCSRKYHGLQTKR